MKRLSVRCRTRLGTVSLAVLTVAVSTVIGGCTTDDSEMEILDCQPGSGQPIWITEGDTTSIEITCQNPQQSLDGTAFSFPDLPAGASYDPITQRLSWTPDLDQAAVWNLNIVAESDGQTDFGTVMIGVADAFNHPDNIPVVDPSAYPLEYGIPVVFLSRVPTQSIDESITVVYGGREISARAKVRGASSTNYPKQSYLLKFGNGQLFYDIKRDFIGKRRVVLTSTFDDNAYFRQRLAYELWNAMEPSIPIQAYNVVVYIGGNYWGLYTITDHLSKHRINQIGLRGDANLYKAINHDANFRERDYNGQPKINLAQGYEKKEGVPQNFSDLEQLVAFTSGTDDITFRDQLTTQINIEDYSKWWTLVTFILATDSGGKNSYHYHDNSRWIVAPWDFNASFGQQWETTRLDVQYINDFGNANEIFRRMLHDPILGPALRDMLRQAITSGPFSVDALTTRIDTIVADIDASAHRDELAWGDSYKTYPRWAQRTDFTDYNGELNYVRTWIDARRQLILDRFAESP